MTDKTARYASVSLILYWLTGGMIAVLSAGLVLFSPYFSYDYVVREMPIFMLVGGLFLAGVLFVGLSIIVRQLDRLSGPLPYVWHPHLSVPIVGIFALGLLARIFLLFSEPVLEDDYQRYLWDGGVLASGINPYQHAPVDVLLGKAPFELSNLAEQAAPIPQRINHKELRTIYPIGAEMMFAVSHYLAPWSLFGLRGLMLLAEIFSFAALALLLLHFGRSPFWISLYWWNPLVLKELINSAHMEALMLPFLLFGILMAFKRKLLSSSLLISLAASFKFWPALLLPLIWQRMISQKQCRTIWFYLVVFLSLFIGVLIILPYIYSGLDHSSGLVAYGLRWKTNSAFFPLFEEIVAHCLAFFDVTETAAAVFARGIIGAMLIGLVFWLVAWVSRHDLSSQRERDDVLLRCLFIVCVAVFLFSPAQFPWYFTWVAPFLVFYPLSGLVALVPLMSFYYLGFYLYSFDLYESYGRWIAIAIWVPVWGLLIFEAMIKRGTILRVRTLGRTKWHL